MGGALGDIRARLGKFISSFDTWIIIPFNRLHLYQTIFTLLIKADQASVMYGCGNIFPRAFVNGMESKAKR